MVQRDFPQAALIRNTENAGFARANNQALQVSRGRYILLLNPDTHVFPDGLDRMMAFMDENPRVGAITAKIWLDTGKTLRSFLIHPFTMGFFIFAFSPLARFFPRNEVLRKIWDADIRLWLSKDPVEVDAFAGACMMIRRETLNNVGPMDDNFFMFFEDLDWCLRMKRAGWKLFSLPEAEIVHLAHQSPSDRLEELYLESLAYYLRKHYPLPIVWGLYLLHSCAGVIARCLERLGIGIVNESGRVLDLASKRIVWPEIPDAKGYVLEISNDPLFTAKGGSVVDENFYEVAPEILERWPNGLYFFRVAPIYGDGHVGRFSDAVTLTKRGRRE